MTSTRNNPLAALPPVGEILDHSEVAELRDLLGRELVGRFAREALAAVRAQLSSGSASDPPLARGDLLRTVLAGIQERVAHRDRMNLGSVVNATGVVLHTSLGRAPLSDRASAALQACSRSCNLEVDLETGARRPRGYQLQAAFLQLTGAEAALVVNNNAAATVLALAVLAGGREVILSRGQLIEIGGAFRLPEVFATSGAILREVGTTNRTRLEDYTAAISPATAAILRVHPSNYRIEGFAETPEIGPLAELGRDRGVLVIDDIGSGCLLDTTEFGLPWEPTFAASLRAGADLVLGSGDKLLGGPQCGILLGRRSVVDRLQRHPLARAFRVDKLTLAALQSTLDAYLAGTEREEIPVWRLLSAPQAELMERALRVVAAVSAPNVGPSSGGPGLAMEVATDQSPVGGGSLPVARLPTAVIRLTHPIWGADELARRLRGGGLRVFPRIDAGRVLLDLRSVFPDEDESLVVALRRIPDAEGHPTRVR